MVEGFKTVEEAEARVRETALKVLSETSPDAKVIMIFPEKRFILAAACCCWSDWTAVKDDTVMAKGRLYCLLFPKPNLRIYMHNTDAIDMIATHEAVHVRHWDHDADFAAAMEKYGYTGDLNVPYEPIIPEGDREAVAYYETGRLTNEPGLFAAVVRWIVTKYDESLRARLAKQAIEKHLMENVHD